jgi:uncharacterized protein (TIGR00369 family)
MVSVGKEKSAETASHAPSGFLDIDVRSSSKDLVVGSLRLFPHHFTADGVVDGGVVMALGNYVASHGASLELPAGCKSATIDSNTSFLNPSATDQLVAKARPLSRRPHVSMWRTIVYGADEEVVAEVTQTESIAPESGKPDDLAEIPSVAKARKNVLKIYGSYHEEGTKLSNVAVERRKQIFRGACDVIAEKGFANAAVRDIAAAAGMPVPTMYQYINGKEDLLALIYEAYLGEINARVEASISQDMSATKKLKAAIRADIESNDVHYRYVKLLFQETRSLNAEGRARVNTLDGTHIVMLREILEEGVASGELDVDDTELAANFIFFLCAIWTLRYWSIGDHGVDAIIDSIVRFVLRAVATEGRAASRGA